MIIFILTRQSKGQLYPPLLIF